jgi:hypothetical protein
MNVLIAPLLRGGAEGWCRGGGVLTGMLVNTPLRPSQEGNRTARRFREPFSYPLIAKHILMQT